MSRKWTRHGSTLTKTQIDAKIRKENLETLARADNYGWCEICKSSSGVSFAHRLKRRKFPSWKKEPEAHIAELRMAAYLCGECHRKLEHGDPQVMYDEITRIIDER